MQAFPGTEAGRRFEVGGGVPGDPVGPGLFGEAGELTEGPDGLGAFAGQDADFLGAEDLDQDRDEALVAAGADFFDGRVELVEAGC